MSDLVLVFPTRNVGDTISHVIGIAKQSKHKPYVLVVDGYSEDNTISFAKKAGADDVISQEKRFYPGKGNAMKTGALRAIDLPCKAILFLDADIESLTEDWIDTLADPVLSGECDMSRGAFGRHSRDGAVTKLVAKSMLSIFFPEIPCFDQPLTGEVCALREVWRELASQPDVPDGWGVDIWFLIECYLRDYRVKEVELGFKKHASLNSYIKDVCVLMPMAKQVAFAILQEAKKYGRLESLSKVKV